MKGRPVVLAAWMVLALVACSSHSESGASGSTDVDAAAEATSDGAESGHAYRCAELQAAWPSVDGVACDFVGTCGVGQECCCTGCHASRDCLCSDGTTSCVFTDACYGVTCPDAQPPSDASED